MHIYHLVCADMLVYLWHIQTWEDWVVQKVLEWSAISGLGVKHLKWAMVTSYFFKGVHYLRMQPKIAMFLFFDETWLKL